MSTLTDTDRRREWATALRWAAAEAARPFGGAQDGDLDSTDLRDLADQIEAGATPWADTAPEAAPSATEAADQPTPGAVAPPDRQSAAEPVDLDAIEARANAATPGPWQVIDPNEGSGVPPAWEVVNDAFLNPSGDDEPWIAVELHVGAGEDAQFIAHARADVPALVARVRQLETDLTELEHLFDLQWRRMGEATELWRAESPAERQLIQPDLGALLAWLMERAATARRVGAADALELARSEADGIDPAVDTVLAHLAAEVRRPHHPHPDH